MSDERPRMYVDAVGYSYYTGLPKLNVDLLTDCVRWVVHNGEMEDAPLWYQTSWATFIPHGMSRIVGRSDYCGTAFCVAGYATFTSGACQYLSDLEDAGVTDLPDGAPNTPLTDPNMVGYDGNLVKPKATEWGDISWHAAARELLGLTDREADALFDGGNSKHYIQQLANEIAVSRGLELGSLE